MTLQGCDVSDLQGKLDVARMKGAGISFIFAQATIGNEPSRNSRWFQDTAAQCAGEGVVLMPYGFAFPLRRGNDPREYARRHNDVVNGAGDGPHMLDLEWPYPEAWAHWGIDAAFISDWGLACCEELEILRSCPPVDYTFGGFWHALGDKGKQAAWARYPLHLAAPGLPKPPVPSPWSDWTFHQTSWHGRVAGCAAEVDLDTFNGDDAALRLLRASVPATAPPLPAFMSTLEIQQALASLGFSPGAIDGRWGPRTRAAVVAFQSSVGLVADGIVGPRTTAALRAATTP